MKFWQYWIGTVEPYRPVMLIRNLVTIGSFKIDLHKMVERDPIGCFHTHPYDAIRVPLWGGYIEELQSGMIKFIYPFRIGRVGHAYSHRIKGLLGSVSYSLWIHGPAIHKVQKLGEGWASQTVQNGYHEGELLK